MLRVLLEMERFLTKNPKLIVRSKKEKIRYLPDNIYYVKKQTTALKKSMRWKKGE